MANERDRILRRIVIEYGREYAYAYWTDTAGKIIDEEVWKQPFKLDVKDSLDEAKDCWDIVYSHLQDTILWTASDAEDDGSVEEPPDEE